MKKGQARGRVVYVRPHRDAYERLRDCTQRAIDAGESALHVFKERHQAEGMIEAGRLTDAVAVFAGRPGGRPDDRTMRELTRRGVFIAHSAERMEAQSKRLRSIPVLRLFRNTEAIK